MLDLQLLSECLKNINENYNSKESRDAIETLLTIHRNVLHNEDDIKYRKIKPDNTTFNRKIWSVYPARQFMLGCGWFEIHGSLIFNRDENLIEVIELLLKFRNVAPKEEEWAEDTKFEGKSEAQLHEEDLRQKAALEREKELKEFNKEKKYREELAKNIKAQIISDRRKKKVYTQPVVGNRLVKGAKIKTLQPSNNH